jgi:hypothetical protein
MTDMDRTAAGIAATIKETLFEAHRGAIPTPFHGILAAFGNDGYTQDERTRAEVERVRELLKAEGIEELGFGVDAEESYTWVLLAKTDDVDLLNRIVWTAHRETWGGDNPVQEQIAHTTILDAPGPDTSMN